MKKKALIIGAVILLAAVFITSRPSRAWNSVTAGMTRREVYTTLGQPTSEWGDDYKHTVHWRRKSMIGNWDFVVLFQGQSPGGVHDPANDTVMAASRSWRWIWN